MDRHPDRVNDLVRHPRQPFQWHAGRRSLRRSAALVLVLALLGPWQAVHAAAPLPGPVLTPDLPSSQPVGTAITWTATAIGMKDPVFRFSVGAAPDALAIVRDFSPSPFLTWAPLHEGSYTIQLTVKEGFTAPTSTSTTTTFAITSRVQGQSAVVNPTANPLVALYSAPACTRGTVVVQFQPASGSSSWQSTTAQPCSAGQSINVLVAGMRPGTRYLLRHVLSTGVTSATSTFITGQLPAGLNITPFSVKKPVPASATNAFSVIFDALIPTASPAFANPIATDVNGQLVWYYDTLHSGLTNIWPVRILSGGTVLLLGLDAYHNSGDDVLREVDLAGEPVRETNVDAVNAQLSSRGQEPIYMFHHDALRLPNGDTAVLGATQNRVSGHNVMSDMLVVLDSNFQVVWTWDMFDHFTPPATWPAGAPTCIVLCALPDVHSIDWTHGNDIGWSAADGNLILSFRNISMIIKIDYRNGRGGGTVLWRLGNAGDFRIKSSDPSPWFSLQHNATYINPTTLVVFDDGNTRCQNGKIKGCQSRGQEYTLDEQHHVATLVVNANLGSFWQALGSAQDLANGDLFYAGGFPSPSREVEVRADNSIAYELDTPVAVYRAYALPGLSF
jgi:arylsulfate sulfotransferase